MGYGILLNYHSNDEAANQAKQEIEAHGVECELLKFDVGNPAESEKFLTDWVESNEDKVIEVLVNNAGIRKDTLMMWMKEDEWHSVLDTSLNGFFYITRLLLKGMLTQKFGRIINVVSLSGLKGTPGQTNYSAAKAAIIGATKALAQEVGRRKVTVNAIAPGFIKTDMTEDINEKEYKSLIPAGRFGTSEEVAELIGFLASPHSSYITGEVININGGLYS